MYHVYYISLIGLKGNAIEADRSVLHRTLIAYTGWMLWRQRNDAEFKGILLSPSHILISIIHQVKERLGVSTSQHIQTRRSSFFEWEFGHYQCFKYQISTIYRLAKSFRKVCL